MPFRATVASRRRTEVVAEEFPNTWSYSDGVITVTPSGVIYMWQYNDDIPPALFTWSMATQTYTRVAGSLTDTGYADGTGTSALFGNVLCMVWNNFMNAVIISDALRIRVVTPSGVVTTLAGTGFVPPDFDWGPYPLSDGVGTDVMLGPIFVMDVVPSNGNIIVGETPYFTLRIITPLGVVTTLAGPGLKITPYPPALDATGADARFGQLSAIAVVPSSGAAVVADENLIRLVTLSGVVTTISGSASYGYVDGPGTIAQFGVLNALTPSTPMCILPKSEHIVIADPDNRSLRMITKDGFVTTLVGSNVSWFSENTNNGPRAVWALSDKELLVWDTNISVMKVTIV